MSASVVCKCCCFCKCCFFSVVPMLYRASTCEIQRKCDILIFQLVFGMAYTHAQARTHRRGVRSCHKNKTLRHAWGGILTATTSGASIVAQIPCSSRHHSIREKLKAGIAHLLLRRPRSSFLLSHDHRMTHTHAKTRMYMQKNRSLLP